MKLGHMTVTLMSSLC